MLVGLRKSGHCSRKTNVLKLTQKGLRNNAIIWFVFYAAITQYALCINKCHFTQPDIRDNDNVTYHDK
jgi:hypothetical protein